MSIEFKIDAKSKYNLDTYSGRLKHFFKLTNPFSFFISDKTIYEKKRMLEDYTKNIKSIKKQMLDKKDIDNNVNQINKENPITSNNHNIKNNAKTSFLLTEQEFNKLWDAKYLVDATFHPDTKEKIPKLFRVNSFTIANVPIIVGLIVFPVTKFNLMFFNIANQSYNATLNYYIGSKTSDGNNNNHQLIISFILAVSSSLGAAFLFKRVLGDCSKSVTKSIIQRVVPSCIAGFINLFFMRSSYFTKGLSFSDANGNQLGTSKKIGTKAMLEGAVSRIILPMPLVISILMINKMQSIGIRGIKLKVSEVILCGVFISLGLPISIALFNQTGKAHFSKLEKENLQKLKLLNYKEDYIYYDKGL